MSDEVALQQDIGGAVSTGLLGLAKFSKILASISADNVTPTALLQSQKLGTMFHISGPLAAKVPDALRRYQSLRIERTALLVGWRRGDAPSLLADSAGGQAAALLVTSISNIASSGGSCGSILYQLSKKLLPQDANIASPQQLEDITTLLRAKMATLDLAGMLAHEATRVRLVYLECNLPQPLRLLDSISTEHLVDALEIISRAVREDKIIARFTGAIGIGRILFLLMAMCPDDCLVTVEGMTVHKGIRSKIIVNIVSKGVLSVQIEEDLGIQGVSIPLGNPTGRRLARDEGFTERLDYKWGGWLGHRLDLWFFNLGFTCSKEIKLACCALLMRYKDIINTSDLNYRLRTALLGPKVHADVRSRLQMVFGVEPEPLSTESPVTLVTRLSNTVTAVLQCRKNCHLKFSYWDVGPGGNENNFKFLSKGSRNASGWVGDFPDYEAKDNDCTHRKIWAFLESTLHDGLASLYVDSAPEAAVPSEWMESACRSSRSGNSRWSWTPYSRLHGYIFSKSRGSLGFGSKSSVVYPSILETLQLPVDYGILYRLVDGLFIINGRCYNQLSATTRLPSLSAPSELKPGSTTQKLVPNHSSEHSELLLTATESYNKILLDCEIRSNKYCLQRNLEILRDDFFQLKFTTSCEHSIRAPLVHYRDLEPLIIEIADPRYDLSEDGVNESGSVVSYESESSVSDINDLKAVQLGATKDATDHTVSQEEEIAMNCEQEVEKSEHKPILLEETAGAAEDKVGVKTIGEWKKRIIQIAMVRGNPEAQFFASAQHTIVQRGCCLQCAWDQAMELNMKRIIVT